MLTGMDTVLEVDRVSKIYSRRQATSRARLGHVLGRAVFGRGFDPEDSILRPGEFRAVHDVSFTLRRGEAIGIIGLNGSGKTTLLRMLAGQILPDAGSVRVIGRTASMIDLTAGFRTGASGRENIFLRGAALGRSREEMNATLDDIIAFSELGEAIDAPVATYSSGMTMRLAFSIMVATVPEILFLDEVLAVGDFQFRQKCFARMREMRGQSAFAMVSHDMNAVRRFCDSVIVLDRGAVVFHGPPEEAIDLYESMKFPEPAGREERIASMLAPQFVNTEAIWDVENYWCDEVGNPVERTYSQEPIFFHLAFRINYAPRKLILGVPVWTEDGTYVTGFSTQLGAFVPEAKEGERSVFRLSVPSLAFNQGTYVSTVGIVDGLEFLYRGSNPDLRVEQKNKLSWGVVTLPHTWSGGET